MTAPHEMTLPDEFLGQPLVLDMSAHYVILGTLLAENSQYFILAEADVHDLRDTSTTRDLYVLDCRKHGIGVNRHRVYVLKSQVVSLSRLDEVAN